MTEAILNRSRSIPGRNRVRPGAALLLAWSLLVGLALLVDAEDVHPDFARRLVGMSTILFGYGLITARLMSGDMSLRRSLATLKLGPWFGVGFAVVFGPTSLVWLSSVRPNPTTEDWAISRAGLVV